jgi:hypothetical protein
MIISLIISDEVYAAYGQINPEDPRAEIKRVVDDYVAKEPEYELAPLVAHGTSPFDILFPAKLNEVLHA